MADERRHSFEEWRLLCLRAFILLPLVLGLSSSADALRVDPATYQRRLKEEKLQKKLDSFEAPPFQVFSDSPLEESSQREIARIIDRAVSAVGDDFRFKPSETAQLSLLHGRTYDSIDDPRIASGGFYRNKKIRMRFNFRAERAKALKEFETVFRHEYTHLVIASLDAGRSPRWLNEGLAVYEEKGRAGRKNGEGRAFMQKMRAKGNSVSVKEFISRSLLEQYTSKSEEFYTFSYLMAKVLVDRYGFSKLLDLFGSMKSGTPFPKAFADTYGIGLEKLANDALES